MKLTDYISNRIVSIVCFVIAEGLLFGLLWLIEVPSVFIAFAETIFLLFFLAPFIWDFHRRSSYYNRLLRLLEQLDEKTLLNQKEAFGNDDTTKLLVNEAMQDITFNFSKIGEEEMKLISGGVELQDKWQRTIRGFTQNIDQDDPEFITLREAFMQRFKEHGFVVNTISEFEEHSKALDEVLKKLAELQKRNNALMKKYKGDAKFARVHKRIREENAERQKSGKAPIVSLYDESIMSVLLSIKSDIDQKVYDRNDILKKDAYFEKTVMTQIKEGMDKLNLTSDRTDRLFIQSRITRQYLNQYSGAFFGEDTSYWPTLAEYDPRLSKEDWKKYLLEVEILNHPSPMKMLKGIMELGGEASCKQLANKYGGHPSVYVGCTTSLGRRITPNAKKSR